MKRKTKFAITAALLTGLIQGTVAHQTLTKNTLLDRTIAEQMCEAPADSQSPQTTITINAQTPDEARNLELTPYFKTMKPGDKIVYGDLTLTATTTYPQQAIEIPALLGSTPNLLGFDCPGMIGLNVTYEGPVSGSAETDIAYGKQYSPKYPVFTAKTSITLENVLSFASIPKGIQEELLSRPIREREQSQREQERTHAARVQECTTTFKGPEYTLSGDMLEYTLQRGDTPMSIAHEFNDCVRDRAFGKRYEGVAAAFGMCTDEPVADTHLAGEFLCFPDMTKWKAGNTIKLLPKVNQEYVGE